jgi:streptogramin lyase
VHPQTGEVWICGTNSDTIIRFDPKTEKTMGVYRMPSHVTYTREIEFAKDGSAWTCNSNLPARHIEGHKGAIIKIEVLDGKGEASKQVAAGD